MSFQVPERFRLDAQGCLAINMDPSYRTIAGLNYGAFLLPAVIPGRALLTIASAEDGWDHVSVSIRGSGKRVPPTWREMCAVKDSFWGPEDLVMQIHPLASEYVNEHEGCLHLWRPNDGREIPKPPSFMVGPTAGQARS